MLWVVYALTCAFALATADVLSKKALGTESVLLITWVRNGYSVPFLLLAAPFVTIPSLNATFWKATAVALPCDIVAIFLYMAALKASPLSLTLPFLSLTPVFLLGTSFLILGEFPDTSGLIGVLLIFVGAYMLNLKDWRKGFFEPFKAISRERGSMLMIVVAFIFSISSNFGKLAITHSNPLFFGVYYNIMLSIVLIPVLWFIPDGKGGAFKRPKIFLAIGFCIAVMMLTHFLALDLTLVPYMISVKRTSLLFGVIYGGLLFKEQNIRERLLGCALMVLGVAFILI